MRRMLPFTILIAFRTNYLINFICKEYRLPPHPLCLRRRSHHSQSPVTIIFAITASDTPSRSLRLSQSPNLLFICYSIISTHYTIHFLPSTSNVTNNNQNTLASAITRAYKHCMYINFLHSNCFIDRIMYTIQKYFHCSHSQKIRKISH